MCPLETEVVSWLMQAILQPIPTLLQAIPTLPTRLEVLKRLLQPMLAQPGCWEHLEVAPQMLNWLMKPGCWEHLKAMLKQLAQPMLNCPI